MGQQLLILNFAVFGASVLQSATGVGFGVVAGPLLLIALNDGTAIQVSVALNLLIAVILAPSLWRVSDRILLRDLLIGLAVGSPIGLVMFLYADIALLKIFAGAVVLFTVLLLLRGNRADALSASAGAGKFEKVVVGFVAGVMGGILAMPGPVPAAWMSARGYNKDTIRATILVLNVAVHSEFARCCCSQPNKIGLYGPGNQYCIGVLQARGTEVKLELAHLVAAKREPRTVISFNQQPDATTMGSQIWHAFDRRFVRNQ